MSQTKKCSKCKVTKELTAFGKNKAREDGLQDRCKDCRKAGYESNKSVILAEYKVKYETDSEFRTKKLINAKKRQLEKANEVAAYKKQYYVENRQRILDEHKQYHIKNAQRNIDRATEWRKDNIEWARKLSVVKEARRRTRKAENGGVFFKEDIDRLYEEQNGKCYYCNTELNNKYDVDHKIPVSRRGTSWPENLCLACPRCNRSKHNQTDTEFLLRRAKSSMP
jgi:5-methylcytosine-specific restriction endonuclease McrA